MSQPSPVAAAAFVGRTLATDITHRLRNDIIACILKPGERLRFEMLRKIYGASFSTLREALTTLASENLVIAEGQRGFLVAPVSRENLLDVTATRVLVERETLRLSMERGDEAWEHTVLRASHRLDSAVRHADEAPSADWERLHREFHDALTSACGSPTLLAFRANLFELSHRYRRLAVVARAITRTHRDNSAEHRAITEATLGRQTDQALRLAELHIRATADDVLQGMSEGGLVGLSPPSRPNSRRKPIG